MDKKHIFLIGGGEISERETEAIDRAALEARQKTGAIVFIGAAAGDSEGYFECFKSYYSTLCDDKDFVFLKSDASSEEARKTILDASLVYLGGGDTQVLKDTLDNWNAKQIFEDAIASGTVLAGISAGAYVLVNDWFYYNNGTIETGSGYGLVPVNLECHSTEESRKSIEAQTEKDFISLKNCEYYSY